jgi:hypothetical protein
VITDSQRRALEVIRTETVSIKTRFHDGEKVASSIGDTAGRAHALYMELVQQGEVLQFSRTMLENRGIPPENPEFFRHLHALEDFVKLFPEGDDGTE